MIERCIEISSDRKVRVGRNIVVGNLAMTNLSMALMNSMSMAHHAVPLMR